MQVTVEQVKHLWTHGGVIDRGDDQLPVTQDDLGVLDVDTDDDGNPLDDQWQVIADQLNSGSATTAEEDFLQLVTDAREKRDKAKAGADEEFNDFIRDFMKTPEHQRPASVTAVAAAAELSRQRMYQIRDGRR